MSLCCSAMHEDNQLSGPGGRRSWSSKPMLMERPAGLADPRERIGYGRLGQVG